MILPYKRPPLPLGAVPPWANAHLLSCSLVAGADQWMRENFGIEGQPTQFAYLSGSGCYTVESVNDLEEFNNICEVCDRSKVAQ